MQESPEVAGFTAFDDDMADVDAAAWEKLQIVLVGEDPDLVWAHDDKPVYCSNMEYDSEGVPSGYRYRTEAQYVDAVDDDCQPDTYTVLRYLAICTTWTGSSAPKVNSHDLASLHLRM